MSLIKRFVGRVIVVRLPEISVTAGSFSGVDGGFSVLIILPDICLSQFFDCNLLTIPPLYVFLIQALINQIKYNATLLDMNKTIMIKYR